jgi:hypothetical protein
LYAALAHTNSAKYLSSAQPTMAGTSLHIKAGMIETWKQASSLPEEKV